MKFLLLPLIFLLVSCDQQPKVDLGDSKVLAVVGETAVTENMFNAFLKANGISNPNEVIAAKALDQLIDEVAMANIAKKKEIKLTVEQLNAMHYLETRAHSQNAINDYIQSNPVTEEEILQEYQGANKTTGGLEYHVRHLLFVDEVDAITMLESIQSPEDYLKQEAEYLKNNKQRNVGDLGWVHLKQLPATFSEVLLTTEPNTVVSRVVKSPFGAHIIYLQDVRDLVPPSFEDVKDGIVSSLNAKRASKFKQLARAKSKVMLRKE